MNSAIINCITYLHLPQCLSTRLCISVFSNQKDQILCNQYRTVFKEPYIFIRSVSEACIETEYLHAILHVCFVSWQILHSTGLEFQHQVQEAKDLDQLIKIHYRYLATIHDRCLLREKVNSSAFPQLKWFSNITKETLPSSIKHFFIHITHL